MGSANDAGDDATGADTICEDACFLALGVICTDFAEGYVKASNSQVADRLGVSVALSGDTQHERSNGDQSNNLEAGSGAAYLFIRSGATWSQRAYIKASNTGLVDNFTSCIALSGNTLVVGAIRESSNATGIDGDQSDNSATYAGGSVPVGAGTTNSTSLSEPTFFARSPISLCAQTEADLGLFAMPQTYLKRHLFTLTTCLRGAPDKGHLALRALAQCLILDLPGNPSSISVLFGVSLSATRGGR